ncbi:FtsX-like permease family protein [Arcanobacterium hippocoleae]
MILKVQVVGDNPPDFRGIVYPKSGEFYASPALAAALEENPEMSVRYGTKYLGELPHSFVTGPDQYAVVIGSSELHQQQDAHIVTNWKISSVDFETKKVIQAVLYLGLIIVLFPVVLLIHISTKLGSVQREQRYAALRLVGATNSQIFWIVTTETLIASVLGFGIGIGLYFALHPLLVEFSAFTGRMWAENIAVTPWHYLITALLTFGLVCFANSWGLKRLSTSPLGIVRRQEIEKKPSFLRALPLFAGIGIFIWLWIVTPKDQGGTETVKYILAAILLIMLGLTLAGTWLTAVMARIFRKISRKPTSYIGWSYVQAHASRISRSVTGVVLALFAGSFSSLQFPVLANLLLQLTRHRV